MERIDRAGLAALHTYNVYANDLVLQSAVKMTIDALTRKSSPSHGSVMALLQHMLGCEYYFLTLCSGSAALEEPDQPQPDLPTLRTNFSRLAAARTAYLDSVSETALGEVIAIHIGKSDLQLPRWQLLAQSLIHSIHHRGELSIVMTELGTPLPTLDPILMYIQQSEQNWNN